MSVDRPPPIQTPIDGGSLKFLSWNAVVRAFALKIQASAF